MVHSGSVVHYSGHSGSVVQCEMTVVVVAVAVVIVVVVM